MATGFAEQYAAEFDEHDHPRDDGGKFTLKVSKVHGPKGEKFENLGGKQQNLFATEGLPGQMNLFADKGVPDELLPKHLREPKRYEKDKDLDGQWVNLGGANAFVGPDGIITKGCEGLRGYHVDDLDDTQDERAAKQDQAEDAGWTSAKSDRAKETWEAFKQSDPTHQHFIGLVRHGGKFHAFDDSAQKLHDHLGIGDGQTAEFDEDTLPHHMERLIEGGHRVAVIDRAEDGRPDLDSEADPAAQQAVEEAHEDLASAPPQQGFGIEEVHPERLKLTQDGQEIGYMNLRVMGDRGFIDDTSIHAAARGQGVMQKLWPQIEQHFRDQGATSIRADVVDPAVGQKVWGPLGFVKEGMSGPVEVYRKQLGRTEQAQESQPQERSSRGTLPPTEDPAHHAVAKRFGIPAETVKDLLETHPDELAKRDAYLPPSSQRDDVVGPTLDYEPHPLGTAKIDSSAHKTGDLDNAYVDFLTEFDPKQLKLSEHEDGMSKSASVAAYVDWLKAGHQPPPIGVFDSANGNGNLVSTNRRRVLAAQMAGVDKIVGWHGRNNPETGLPLKFGDIKRAYQEATQSQQSPSKDESQPAAPDLDSPAAEAVFDQEQPADKPLWQQTLQDAIPDDKIDDQAAFDEHRQAVEQALQAGQQVPEEVMADYPDIREKMVKSQAEQSHDVLSQLQDRDELSRDDIGRLLASQHHNIDARAKGVRSRDAESLADKWVDSPSFVKMEIPIDVAQSATAVQEGDRSVSPGAPIVVDSNKTGAGRLHGSFGAPADFLILDGKHRHAAAKALGEKTITAFVGSNAVPRIKAMLGQSALQPDVSPEDTSAADAWNAATKDPSSASDEQLQQAIDFATHLHGQHRQNDQLTPEQLTSLQGMIDGHVASLQQELSRRNSGDDQSRTSDERSGGPHKADGGHDRELTATSQSDRGAAGSQQSPDSGVGKGELDSPASLSLPDRHAAAGDRIKQAKGPLKSLLESLHRLRDTRKTGKVETKELGHEYAREMYDHLKSLRAQGGDEFGEVHDLSEELGHGALGYASPAGNIALVPPKFKGEDWQTRYTLPDPSQQAEPAAPEPAAQEPAAPAPSTSQAPPEPVAAEPDNWVAPWEDAPAPKKPKKGVNPKTKLGRAVIEAVGDDPEAQRHFHDIVKQIHADLDTSTRERNAALRELLSHFGVEGRDIGQFVLAVRRHDDADAFMRKSALGRKFDQMVEMAQNYYPQLLHQGTGESITADPEYALFERLKNGLERPPQPYDEQVIGQALDYFAAQERSSQEHLQRMENDPEYRQSFEDLKTAVFSRQGWKLRYAKWACQRLSRWYRYARQLSLFDDAGGSQPETKPAGKEKQKGLFDEDSHPRATEHVEIQGKAYEGGQWIPKEAAAEATPAEAEKIEVVDKDTGKTEPMEEAVSDKPEAATAESQADPAATRSSQAVIEPGQPEASAAAVNQEGSVGTIVHTTPDNQFQVIQKGDRFEAKRISDGLTVGIAGSLEGAKEMAKPFEPESPAVPTAPAGWQHEAVQFDGGDVANKYTSQDGKHVIWQTEDGQYELQQQIGGGVAQSSVGTFATLDEAVAASQPAAPPAPSTPTTFDPERHGGYQPLLGLAKEVREGKFSADEYKQQYAFWRQHGDEFQADLQKRFNAQKLKAIASNLGDFNASRNSKGENAKSVYERLLLHAFHTGGTFSYGMEGRLAALDRYVASQTDDKLAQTKAAAAEEAKQNQAAIENPQTLSDFHDAIRHYGGYDKLPEGLQAAYDDLYATARREGDKSRQATVSGFRRGAEATGEIGIVQGHHQKRNAPTWTVTIEKHLGDDWNEALSRAKQLGGSYVNARIARAYNATPGFQFFDQAQAEKFAQTLRGQSVDRSDVMDERRAGQIDNASERMAALAKLQRERAQEKLNAPRQTNTTRRAEMASNAEAAARSEIAKANTMERLSEGLQNGTIKHLAGIRARTHVDALDSALRGARYRQYQQQSKGQHVNYEDFMSTPASVADVAKVEYPYPTIWASELNQHINEFADTPGLKKLAATLKKSADRSPFAKRIGSFATDGGVAKTAEDLNESIPGAKFYLKDKAVRIHASRDPKLLQGRHAIAYTADKGKTWGISPEIAAAAAFNKNAEGLDLIDPPKDELLKISDEQTIGQLETAAQKLKRSSDPRLRRIAESLHGRVEDYKRMQSMDIRNVQELRAALREYLPLRAKQEAEDPVKAKERALVGRDFPGFFPTPRPLIHSMLDAADIQPGMSVLEPSAGKGDILDAVKERHPDAQTKGIEYQPALRDVIQTKGHELADENDFLSHAGQYDRIVMNPPFENRQDVQHVQHAYQQLKPGGRLVAVMSSGPFHGSQKRDEEFRNWLNSVGAEIVDNPEGSFAGSDAFRKTGVNTKMVVIDR